MHKHQHRELRKIKKWRNIYQTKEQDKFPETNLSETEISDLANREFKITVIKMLQCEESKA